ncbi:hypothetical protein H9Y05_01230 [Crocinitomicaceae bacterium CZZ-1]|uniref:Uncharacterized protein n=1 Tax=Taishania pollutisoli TaxID=2766479 RepID=A0A8J6P753_9FLAO|nr:hypothetical protein [Taishania pollutisoli]MBC9811086.1 hypothetical protein [Taishania pollutisoli]
MSFNEDDLLHDDYENTTTPGDDPNYTGKRDRDRVNKKELYEVVYFCNAFMEKHKLEKKDSFQKIERIIRLPEASGIVMRDDLIKFVENKWNEE